MKVLIAAAMSSPLWAGSGAIGVQLIRLRRAWRRAHRPQQEVPGAREPG